jgi:hypothetical protein
MEQSRAKQSVPNDAIQSLLTIGKVMQHPFSGRRYDGPVSPHAAVPAAAKRVALLS